MPMTRTPRNPLYAKYPGCTPRQIARLMLRAISMAATSKHPVSRFELAEEMICEAMDLTEWASTEDQRERLVTLLRDALTYTESGYGNRPRTFFRPLP